MSTKNQNGFSLRDANGNFEAPLLDRLMNRNKVSLKEQGIEIDHMSQTKNERRPMWAELESLYATISQGLIDGLANYKGVYDAVKNFPLPGVDELALQTKALTTDGVSIANDLAAVYARHKDFKGEVKSGDEEIIHANCGNDYTGLHIKWQGLIHPAFVGLTEFQAQAKLWVQEQTRLEAEKEANALTPEQDPAVITDVEVKEQ